MQGGNRGVAIAPGNPDGSLLITAIRHMDRELKMPEEKLPAAEIAAIEEWMRRGAPDPRAPAMESTRQRADQWWAMRNLAKPAVPRSSDAHPVDAFVRAKLAEHSLDLSPEADRRTLIRNLTFDLHGLPPTPSEVDAFIGDKDPLAYDKLMDRLLASTLYGEQGARLVSHELDASVAVPLFFKALELPLPKSPDDLSARREVLFEPLKLDAEARVQKYAEEMGANAYALFNAVTDFASRPAVLRDFRRSQHSMQTQAGRWLREFDGLLQKDPKPNFTEYLADYRSVSHWN